MTAILSIYLVLRAVMDYLIYCSHSPRVFSSKEGYVDIATTVTVAVSYLVTWGEKKPMQLLGQIILEYFVHCETGKVK